MFDRLAEAQRLLAEEFADSRARGAAGLSDAELAERVEAAQRAANMAQAVQAQRVAQYAAREDVRFEDGTLGQQDRGLGHVSAFASGVVGPRLGLSPAGADRKVHLSARLASRFAPTLAVMAAGDLDDYRASVLVTELADAGPDVAAAVQDVVLPQAPTQTAAQLRAAVRRALARLDPEALRAKVEANRTERGLWKRPGEPGVSEWLAVLPNETSAACWAAVDELARRYRADGDARTLDQARADAMADLVLGSATVTTTVTFALPAVAPGGVPPTLEGLSPLGLPLPDPGVSSPSLPGSPATESGVAVVPDGVGPPDVVCAVTGELLTGDVLPVVEVPGVGEVPGQVVRGIVAAFGTRAVLALCDWRSGTLASETCEAYRPPAWLERLVKARDGTCRFFGCTVPARRCDVDHVVAHPRGPTEVENLMCLCRHHHRLKQQERWAVRMTPDGAVTWTTPVGDEFTTWSVDHLGVRDLAS
jgi:hypothetical protein